MGDLMRLFTDSDYFENQFNHAVKSYFGNVESSLKKTDKGYELVVPVADDATAKNVTVDFDDKDRLLTIKYSYKSKNCSTATTISETFPEDADEETLSASVSGGKLKVSADFLPKKEILPDEDTKTVKINRI